jgi:hypothetical protein
MIANISNKVGSNRPRDFLVTALRELGGLGSLPDIYSIFGRLSGRVMDYTAQAKVRQTLQECSSDASWERPKSAPDLFYSLEGVGAKAGIWGLRQFSPQTPSLYPRTEIHREYAVLLHRN